MATIIYNATLIFDTYAHEGLRCVAKGTTNIMHSAFCSGDYKMQ